jgi:hypothetical protein
MKRNKVAAFKEFNLIQRLKNLVKLQGKQAESRNVGTTV